MREKLIELFFDYQEKYNSLVPSKDGLADHLLANGVIVLPCKVGDTVYDISEFVEGYDHPEMYEMIDCEIAVSNDGFFSYDSCFIRHEDFGKTLFLTREDAENALKEGKG